MASRIHSRRVIASSSELTLNTGSRISQAILEPGWYSGDRRVAKKVLSIHDLLYHLTPCHMVNLLSEISSHEKSSSESARSARIRAWVRGFRNTVTVDLGWKRKPAVR